MNNFWTYIEQLELLTFFSGYPLIYFLVQVLLESRHKKSSGVLKRCVTLLPYSYALTGTLFLGLILKNLYPDYSLQHINEQFQNVYLKIWGLLSLLFWIPLFSKKTVYSLLHSLVFFFIFVKDLFSINNSSGQWVIKNDMHIYTTSLLINVASFLVVCTLFFFGKKIRINSIKR